MSIYVIAVMCGVSFAIFAMLLTSEKNRKGSACAKWIFGSVAVISILCIVMIDIFDALGKESTAVVSSEIKTQQLTELDNESGTYVLQDGDRLKYAYTEEYKVKLVSADIADSKIKYDANKEIFVNRKETVLRKETWFLFIVNKETETKVEYEFHLKDRSNLRFNFEN